MEIPEQDRRVLRIMAVALASGPILFLAVVMFLRTRSDAATPDATPLTFACFVGAAAVVGAHILLSRQRPGDLVALKALVIKRLAVSEGAALFACVAYLLEGRIVAGGLAAGVVGFMLSQQFPSDERLAELG